MLKLAEVSTKIDSFQGLIDALAQQVEQLICVDDARAILERFEPNISELNAYLNFSDVKYQRNLVFKNDYFEVLVLCWKPGQVTPIHNHRHSWCGVRVLKGIATEFRFEETPCGTWIPADQERVYEGGVTSSFDTDTHILGNFETQDLVTMHCYAPPLQDYDIVDVSKTIASSLNTVYRVTDLTRGMHSKK